MGFIVLKGTPGVSDIGLTYRYLSGKLSDILRRKFGHLLARYRLKNTGTTAKSQ